MNTIENHNINQMIMELKLYEDEDKSDKNTSSISSINLKQPEPNCENQYVDLIVDPSDVYEEPVPSCENEYVVLIVDPSDVYKVITNNNLDVNTSSNPIDVSATANPVDVNTTANPVDVNTTANTMDRNTTADTFDVNNQITQHDHSWWKQKKSKWLLGAVAVAAGIGLIVWIASANNWTRKEDDNSQITNTTINPPSEILCIREDDNISPITFNTTIHPASEINWSKKEDFYQKHGKGKAVRQDSFIGFTAWAQSPIDSLVKKVIRFSGVHLNEGGLYSTVTGQFSCNVSGVYYIAVTLKRTANADERLDIAIYKGEEIIMIIYDLKSENIGMSVTNSRLVVCKPGEDLSMRTWMYKGSLYGEPGVPHSTLTAFLMHETDTSVKKHDSFVGFSAAHNTNQKYAAGDSIEFSMVLYNDGGHFKPNSDSFVCPLSGIFFVSVALCKRSNDSLNVCVSKTTGPFLHIVDSDSPSRYSTSSNTALFRCKQNESIIMKGMGKGAVEIWPRGVTSFTVMLLRADGTLSKASLVAFSMYKKVTQSYRGGDTISFGGVIMNEGNYFVSNQFVCPSSGIFYISLNAKKAGVSPLSLDVKVQTATVLHLESIETTNPGITTSGSVLVQCHSNDVIQVKGGVGCQVFGHNEERHTTFSVIMMYQN